MFKKLLLTIPLVLSLNATAELDRYAGMSIGASSTDRYDKSGLYFKVYGGTQVTDFMNLEFGFHYFGSFEQNEPTPLIPTNTAPRDGALDGFSGADFGSIRSVSKDLDGDGTAELYNQFTGTLSSSPMGVSFVLAPFYEIHPGLEIFAKAGAIAWWAELEDLTLDSKNSAGGAGERSTTTRNIDSIGEVYGFGIKYQIMPMLSVRAETEQFELSEKTFAKTAVDIYMISTSFHF
jgi:hypothetical protein